MTPIAKPVVLARRVVSGRRKLKGMLRRSLGGGRVSGGCGVGVESEETMAWEGCSDMMGGIQRQRGKLVDVPSRG